VLSPHRLESAERGALAATGGLRSRASAAAAYDPGYSIESGADLRVLRWKHFVQGDEGHWMANMVAAAASGESSPQTAAQRAERRANHYYS